MSDEEPRRVHIDLAKDGDRTGVVVVQTWECKTCKERAPRGKPCPKCGKHLLCD